MNVPHCTLTAMAIGRINGLWLFAVMTTCVAVPPLTARAATPNVVFILADDMGYGDVQALNSNSQIPTPQLNRLAREGMMFTDAHSPSAVCTPTRYGIITGRYCWRTQLKRGVLNGYAAPLIDVGRATVGSFMKSQGYATGIVGKWHLGLGFTKDSNRDGGFDFAGPVNRGPYSLGFDFAYTIPASLDFPPYVYVHNGRTTALPSLEQPAQKFPAFLRRGPRAPDLVMEECLDHLTEKAVGFIRQHAGTEKPFFLYFPLTAPHKPVLPHPRFVGNTDKGLYGDFVTQVDFTVGQILKAIDQTGISEETLLIYTSDNGSFMYRRDEPHAVDHVDDSKTQAYRSDRHTSNHVFRGTKADIWEAGHRVPFLIRWPDKIEPNSRCEKTICHVDLFATLADIVGASVPEGSAADSYSILPLMMGNEQAHSRPPVIHHSASGMFAIRASKWKLVLGNGSGGRERPRGTPFERPYTLFDISADPAERVNVIEQFPNVAKQLELACVRIRDSEFAVASDLELD